jgi:DUF4097 and DUF4098 domain-containing protein YvlB
VLTGLEAVTVDGSIAIELLDGSVVSQDWRLSSTSGSIALAVPSSVSADLKASTVDGQISVEIPAVFSTRTQRSVLAKLGNGGGRISITSTDGSIRVERLGSNGDNTVTDL